LVSGADDVLADDPLDPKTVQGTRFLKSIFPLLSRLADSGCQRDRAGNRKLLFSQYAGLVLVSLFNPTLQSLQSLSDLARLKKVQRLLGNARVSVGSLSESVRVFEPWRLEEIFQELLQEIPRTDPRGRSAAGLPAELVSRLQAVDGTSLRILPQLVAAAGDAHGKWRMHLQFSVSTSLPSAAVLTPDEAGGDCDERSVLAAHLAAGRIYIADRGYERYSLFAEIMQAGSDFVCRVQRRVMQEVQPQALSPAAVQAGVLSDELVHLGRSRQEVGALSEPVRRIVIAGGVPQGPPRSVQPRSSEIVLLTSLIDVPAEVIAGIYRLRWSIELFFRFLKHVLGCRHLLSTKGEGITIQIYCALIACLLLTLTAGRSLGMRGYRLICLYLQGWADEDELLEGLQRIALAKTK
jgi:hypothetical protein